MSTGQFGYDGVPGCCVDPVSGCQMLSSYFMCHKYHVKHIETMQPRPFEEWIEKGHMFLYIHSHIHKKNIFNSQLLIRPTLCVCCFVLLLTDIGESLRSRGQFLTAVDLGWPDPHPSP